MKKTTMNQNRDIHCNSINLLSKGTNQHHLAKNKKNTYTCIYFKPLPTSLLKTKSNDNV